MGILQSTITIASRYRIEKTKVRRTVDPVPVNKASLSNALSRAFENRLQGGVI